MNRRQIDKEQKRIIKRMYKIAQRCKRNKAGVSTVIWRAFCVVELCKRIAYLQQLKNPKPDFAQGGYVSAEK